MPKPQYSQKFRDAWLKDENLKDWLIAVSSMAGNQAKCKICHIFLNNHYNDLKRHTESKKHKTSENIVFGKLQQKFAYRNMESSLEEKRAEAKLALYIACHTSINAVDHLSEVCKTAFHRNPITDNLRLHRSKCTCILNNVLALYFQHNLLADIGNSFFSIIIDKSTDISVQKFLGIIIIYFSESQNKIVMTFLDMPQLFDFSANGIVEVIKKTLNKYNFKLNNLIGIGTDNASVMTGINNGVYAKLKKEIPNLILIRCICHSLQLAVSAASEVCLPRNLEYLVRETYDWFARSSSRQNTYKNLYKAINTMRNHSK